MKTIWKFPFPIEDEITLTMPEGARVLAVQMQGNTPCLWALVDPDAPTKPCRFRLFGTGHPVPEGLGNFIGTFQMMGGGLIWHLFEAA